MNKIASISEVIDNYDTFILDQLGVVHMGGDVLPSALNNLKLLKSKGKRVLFLSNSGLAGSAYDEILPNKGINRDYYIDMVTSGDHMRLNYSNGLYQHLGKKVYLISWDDHLSVPNELGLSVTDIQNADYILCVGVQRGTVDAYMSELQDGIKRGLSMIISNPDFYAMDKNSGFIVCPGLIAKTYESMGGKVYTHGKPSLEIYNIADKRLGGVGKAIAVGDSLFHDIVGANNFGIDSIFITGGIHCDEIKSDADVTIITKKYGIEPTYYLDLFK